jgi:3-hydroxy-3-methylglutaryl CoA synthase
MNMSLTDITKAIKKQLRKREAKTAASLAYVIFQTADGRLVSRALGMLVANGEAVCAGGRPKAYLKP